MKEKQNKKMKYSIKTLVSIGAVSLFVIGFTVANVVQLMHNEDMTFIEALEETAKWNTVVATNISVTNGETGIVNFGTYTHQSSPYTLYDDALTEANFYEHFDGTPACGEELEGTTPYLTNFDFVAIVQWDYDHAYNGTGWDKTLVRAYMNVTCACDSEVNGITTELLLEGDFYDIDGTNDAKMNMYTVGTGGYDIPQGCTFTINNIKLEWYGTP